MKSLSHQGLITAYFNAIHLQLDDEFIQLLLLEIKRRNIDIDLISVDNDEISKPSDESK